MDEDKLRESEYYEDADGDTEDADYYEDEEFPDGDGFPDGEDIDYSELAGLYGGEKERKTPPPTNGGKLKVMGLVLLLLVLAAGAAVSFIYRDRLFARPEPALTLASSGSEPFTYEAGSEQSFSLAGNGLAVVTTSGFQLSDKDGETAVKQICSFDTPAIAAGSFGALFYDIGGEACKLAKWDGTVLDIDAGGAITGVFSNDGGYFVLISEESGYKGLVTAYNPSGEALFSWSAGSGYPVCAALSEDNRSMAVLCLEDDGSALHFFRLTDTEEQGYVRIENTLLFDMRYMDGSRICLLGEDCLYFVDDSGDVHGVYDFGGRYLCDYSLDSPRFAVVCLSEYSSGSDSVVVSVDTDGEEQGSVSPEDNVASLSANERNVLVMTSGSLEMYSGAMSLRDSRKALTTSRQALLRPDGDILLISAYSAEKFRF